MWNEGPQIEVRSGDKVRLSNPFKGDHVVTVRNVTLDEFTYEEDWAAPGTEMSWHLRIEILELVKKGPNW